MTLKFSLFIAFILILTIYIPVSTLKSQEKNAALREDFQSLGRWESFSFRDGGKKTSYAIVSEDGVSFLKAESNDSASAIIYKDGFNVYEFPTLRWRWKVENVYKSGDAKTKDGDDYPLRIYVLFEYDPAKAGFWERTKYKAAKTLYGQYPPHSSLNYIWANKEHEERILTSTYTDKSKMILLQKGSANTGRWIEEEVNMVADYEKAFGEKPSLRATIGIMNDSDNTAESSVSYVDFIEAVKR